MNWTTAQDLKAELARRWERGDLLHIPSANGQVWPMQLRLRAPSAGELTEHFDAVREWVAALAAIPHLRLDWRETRHRLHGTQRLPERAWVDGPDAAFALLGKQPEAARWQHLVAATETQLPVLLPWLSRRPLQAIGLTDAWSRLLAVVHWVMLHPRPGTYLRQVDVPGVHSKFIEAHRAVLAELLDLALPGEAIDDRYVGLSQFCRRYGFLDKPQRIRFRVLDPGLQAVASSEPLPDVSLDAASFRGLSLPVRRVFITENETNFLAFPPSEGAIVVFGAGYGWEALGAATWLANCPVHYWGDIDTHGFAILDQLRSRLPQVASFLMDRETLLAHREHWGEEPEPLRRDLDRLTAVEQALYDDLRDNRLRAGLRLEQERIGFRWLVDALAVLRG